MIQADMMRNKPLVPSALEPLRGTLSPHYKSKKKGSRRSNDIRDHRARAAIMVARSDVNSMLVQQEQERLVDIRSNSMVSPSSS